jgi:hypothetical protein
MAHESNLYDFTVTEHAEGKALLIKTLGRAAVVAVPLGMAIFFCVINMPMLAILPVAFFGVVLFFWKWFNREFKYELESGNMSFYILHEGKLKMEKKNLEFCIKDAEIIAPLDDEGKAKIAEAGVQKTYNFASSLSKGYDIYYAIVEINGVKSVIYFEATTRALQILYYYNHNTVATYVAR